MPCGCFVTRQLVDVSHDSGAPETVVEAHGLRQTQFLVADWFEQGSPPDPLLPLRAVVPTVLLRLLNLILYLLQKAYPTVLADWLLGSAMTP